LNKYGDADTVRIYANVVINGISVKSNTVTLSIETSGSETDAETAYQALKAAFYEYNEGDAYYIDYGEFSEHGKAFMWTEANLMELAIDSYEETGSEVARQNIYTLYDGINDAYDDGYTRDTMTSNDDVCWVLIACERAYQATGDRPS
jgi:hypothetical protein